MRRPVLPTLNIAYDKESWRLDAACRGTFDLMFDRRSVAAAVALCDHCPVFDKCEAYAIEFRPPAGIWAGIESKTRERARKRRLRAARY